jgi:hypothetical protein
MKDYANVRPIDVSSGFQICFVITYKPNEGTNHTPFAFATGYAPTKGVPLMSQFI